MRGTCNASNTMQNLLLHPQDQLHTQPGNCSAATAQTVNGALPANYMNNQDPQAETACVSATQPAPATQPSLVNRYAP